MMTSDALRKLHTAMLDTREGYEVAERDAETTALQSLFAGMVAMRERDHAAIHEALIARGEQPDEGGSFMATVHKAVTSVRAAVIGLDEHGLSPFIHGEEKVVEAYDAAIAEEAGDAATSAMLQAQKAELLGKVAEMKAMITF